MNPVYKVVYICTGFVRYQGEDKLKAKFEASNDPMMFVYIRTADGWKKCDKRTMKPSKGE
jgi:hypothetical protein